MTVDADGYVDEQLLMLPAQIEQVEYDLKWGASRGGNGAGKTVGWAHWLWLKRMEVYPLSGFVATGASYRQLDEGIYKTLQDTWNDHGLRLNRDYQYWRGVGGAPRLRLIHNGATIYAWSADMALRVKGSNVQTLVLEEPQTWGPRAQEAWEAISTRLRMNSRVSAIYPDLKPQGRISFNPTNVGHGHWLYNLLEVSWPKEGYRVWQMSSRANTILAEQDPEYVHNLETSRDESRWPVEIEGEYATSGGDVYRKYNSDINGKNPALLYPGLPALGLAPQELLWALDFNVGLQCSTISQAHVQQPFTIYENGRSIIRMPITGTQRRSFYTFGEIKLPRAGAEDAVAEFVKIYGEHARRYGVTVYGDSTGGAQSSMVSGDSAILSNWDAIYWGLYNAGIAATFKVQSRNPNPWERVNAVNSQFHTSGGTGGHSAGRDGYGAFIDALACPRLVQDFAEVPKTPNKNDIDKSDKSEAGLLRTHMSDAYGYMIWLERKLEYDGPNSVTFKDFTMAR